MNTEVKDKVPLSIRVSWGAGGLSSYILANVFFAFGQPIYQVALKLEPVTVGLLIALPQFLGLVFDPLLGNITDNARTRWGRRRPFILMGAVGTAILLPLLWMMPFSSSTGMLVYFLLIGIAFSIFRTFFEIPYTALGYEMTPDYDERSRVLAWRMYVGFAGMLLMPWLYKLCLLPYFKDLAAPGMPYEIIGVRWVSLVLSAVVIATALLVVCSCRESVTHQNPEKIGIWKALTCTFKNRAFLLLLGVKLVLCVGIAIVGALPLYINLYYVCMGGQAMSPEALQLSKGLWGSIAGWMGMAMGLSSYVALPLATWLSTHTSKRTTMAVSLSIALFGYASMWFTFDPANPWLQLISSIVGNFGMVGCWLMMSSMVADVCDEDEVETGLRREGVYSASVAFTEKLAFAITTALSGFVLSLAGFHNSTSDSVGVPVEVILSMKGMLVGSQVLAILLGLLGCLLYPITRERSEATRRKLEARKTTLK